MSVSRLEQRLAGGDVVILDGATGTELERRGVPMDGQAWSATANLTHPDVVRSVHEDYIRAGADVIITNTFATARSLLDAAGLGERVVEVNRRAVELAREARDRAAGRRDVWVAGSMSTMAPGAEPARRPSVADMSAMLGEQADILARAGADLLVLEMMRDVDYGAGAVDAARATGLPVWVGFSCRRAADGTVRMFSGVRDDLAFADVIAPVMARGGAPPGRHAQRGRGYRPGHRGGEAPLDRAARRLPGERPLRHAELAVRGCDVARGLRHPRDGLAAPGRAGAGRLLRPGPGAHPPPARAAARAGAAVSMITRAASLAYRPTAVRRQR